MSCEHVSPLHVQPTYRLLSKRWNSVLSLDEAQEMIVTEMGVTENAPLHDIKITRKIFKRTQAWIRSHQPYRHFMEAHSEQNCVLRTSCLNYSVCEKNASLQMKEVACTETSRTVSVSRSFRQSPFVPRKSVTQMVFVHFRCSWSQIKIILKEVLYENNIWGYDYSKVPPM